MNKIKSRILASATLLVMSTGASLALAAPAQATIDQCATYLADRGYSVGPIVKGACKTAADKATAGAITKAAAQLSCRNKLIDAGVSQFHAEAACTRAQWL
jgi:hypothetical protein